MTTPPTKNQKNLYKEECEMLASVMNTKHAAFLSGRSFSLSAFELEGALYATALLSNGDQTFYYPVETRIDYNAEEMGTREAFMFLVDYMDSYFEEHLTESDELMLPIDWTNHQYDAIDFQIRGQIFNKKIEDMALALLERHAPKSMDHSDLDDGLGQD